MKLQAYFAEDEIIRQVCKQRIQCAQKTHERQDLVRLTGQPELEEHSNYIRSMVPPRRAWAMHRPKNRSKVTNANFSSLVYATLQLMRSEPNADWARALREFINRVQCRVFSDAAFVFQPPKIRWEKKEDNKYRPLAVFSPEDRVINSLAARYFRDFCDRAFEPTSFAFRSRTTTGVMPTHHSAFELIYKLRTTSECDLFVAEADISAFYDCVGHEIALQAAVQTIKRAETLQPGMPFDLRAMRILTAYLGCYSFPKNVIEGALQRLQHHGKYPRRDFPWPEEALANFYNSPRSQAIGVPQGGALSCIIANLVLDKADKAVGLVSQKLGLQVHYFRYCDDMIVLARQDSDCRESFEAYLAALKELKLPHHEPTCVAVYGKAFWKGKSKETYSWTGRKGIGCVPWVQFVGYQVRYDGLVRIKHKSVVKQLRKIRNTVDHYKFGIARALQKPGGMTIAATKEQTLESLRWKLVYSSVGRVNPKERIQRPRPMCWAGGYKALHGKPIASSFLKRLDWFREKQIVRMDMADIHYGPGTRSRNKRRARCSEPIGAVFSYLAQFRNTGGQYLIEHPYQSTFQRFFGFKKMLRSAGRQLGCAARHLVEQVRSRVTRGAALIRHRCVQKRKDDVEITSS